MSFALSWRSAPVMRPLPDQDVMLVSLAANPAAASPAAATSATATPPQPSQSKLPTEFETPAQESALKIRTPAIAPPDADPLPPAAPTGSLNGSPVALQPSQPSPAVMAIAAAQSDGGGCRILETLEAMLRASGEVHQALPLIPARSRSVANAVVLWNRDWTETSVLGGAAVAEPLRSTVQWGVRAAPASCQNEAVRGPRLITVSDQRDTVVLAFGSGEWRWADLLLGP